MNDRLKYFPKYDKLNILEKILMNTCCYFPPKPRRILGKEVEFDLAHIKNVLKSSYGKNVFTSFNGKSILDFGCGEGGLTLAIADEVPNSKVTGIDILDNFNQAKKYIKQAKISNLEFSVSPSSILVCNSFDFVISHDSFEHFENPHFILSEMLRVVKPDGYLLIKFGPTWRGPYGRHMSGTFKKSTPWLHLVVPEKNMMRVHSVYHNREKLFESYSDLIGGLNKMTVKQAFQIFNSFESISIEEQKIKYVWRGRMFKSIPIVNELFTSSLYVKLKKNHR